MKTTEWFPATVNPVHIGYYEVRYSWEKEDEKYPSMHFWDGQKWQFDEGLDGYLSWGNPIYQKEILKEFWRGLKEKA
jgi:hypothetical protein